MNKDLAIYNELATPLKRSCHVFKDFKADAVPADSIQDAESAAVPAQALIL